MEILGIGPLEFVFILLIALIVLGPKDMVKAGRTIGRTLRMIVTSDTWRVVQQASKEVRNLPNRLIREAGIEDLQKQMPGQNDIKKQLGLDELEKSMNKDLNAGLTDWTTPPPTIGKPETFQPTSGPGEDAGGDTAEQVDEPASEQSPPDSDIALPSDAQPEKAANSPPSENPTTDNP